MNDFLYKLSSQGQNVKKTSTKFTTLCLNKQNNWLRNGSKNPNLKLQSNYEMFFYFVFAMHKHLNIEEFEDTKGVIRIRKLKDRQHNAKGKSTKGQTTI